jgi:hypothetical protein
MPPKRVPSGAAASARTASAAKTAGAKAASAKAASVKAASVKAKAASVKAANAFGAPGQLPPRPDDPAHTCRMQLFDGYRKACAAKTDKCPATHQAELEQCSQFGVGSQHWPLDMWPLPQENQDALKAAGMNFRKGRKCLSQVWWKLHEAELKGCGPTQRSLSRARRLGPGGVPPMPGMAAARPQSARAAGVNAPRPASKAASVKKAKTNLFPVF